MEEYRKKTNSMFIFAVIGSIAFVVAIPGIVVSAINHIWWLMGICIGIDAFFFYGLPMFWINYSTKKKRLRILDSINTERLYDLNDLALQQNSKVELLIPEVKYLIEHKYLKGFNLVGLELQPLNTPESKILHCAYCGLVVNDPNMVKCPNCGAVIQKRIH